MRALYGLKFMKRTCPNCREKAVPISKLVLSSLNVRCENCRVLVGTHWILNFLFFTVAFVVCLFSTLLIIDEVGSGFEKVVLIVLVWILAGILREVVVPLEIKVSRID